MNNGDVCIYCFYKSLHEKKYFYGRPLRISFHSAVYMLYVSITFPSRTLSSVLPNEEGRLGVP